MKNLIVTLSTTIMLFSSCNEPNHSNRLNSDDFGTTTERMETLKKEINSPSEFENAEFQLFNVNGFSNSRISVPGATSLDYKFVVKVNPSELDKWTNGLISTDPKDKDLDWTKEIVEKRKDQWTTQSQAEFYTRENENVIIIVYRPEGIIFKRIIID